jgi:hypothetical protein
LKRNRIQYTWRAIGIVFPVTVLVLAGCGTPSARNLLSNTEAGSRSFHPQAVLFAEKARYDPAAVDGVMSGEHEEANAAWWGFEAGNATDALQSAIRSGARVLRVPNLGTPWRVDPIYLESDQEIIFEQGTVVAAREGSFQDGGDCLFLAEGKKNITLKGYGAVLEMRKQDYTRPPYRFSEWRHAISIRGSRNVRIHGLTIRSSGGDGIYVRGGSGTLYSEDIEIRDAVLYDHYRQGISVISVRNLLVENCQLLNTGGTAPQAGIDFEPNRKDEYLINCLIRNCTIVGNRGPGVLAYLGKLNKESAPVSIRVESSTIRRNRAAIWIDGVGKKPKGSITFIGNDISGWKFVRRAPLLDVVITSEGKAIDSREQM